MMKAVVYDAYGGGTAGLKHVEVPIPSPGKNELIVKVKATSLNAAEWKIQKGMLRPFLPGKFPFIPTTDIAGEVTIVGSDVKDFIPGDRVVTKLSTMKGGGLAEYALATAKDTVKLPPDFTFENAASLPIAAGTALQAIRDVAGVSLDGNVKSVNVLVIAASGGVGHFAVQIAKLSGAHVTATCGTRNLELVKELGADEVLDYKTDEGETLKSPSGCKYDVVIRCASGIPWSAIQPNLTPNGKVVDIAPDFKSFTQIVVKKLTWSKQQISLLVMKFSGRDLALIVDLVNEGKIKVIIDSIYPFDKVEDAWTKLMDGHAMGKIIVTFDA